MHSPRLLLGLLLGASWATADPATKGLNVKVRWVVILLAIGVALDLLISLALGYVAVQARNAASQAHVARVATYEACLTSNATKTDDLKRWDEVLALVSDGRTDTATLRFVQQVGQINKTADAPRDCGALVP